MKNISYLYIWGAALLLAGCSFFKAPVQTPAPLVHVSPDVLPIKTLWTKQVGERTTYTFVPVALDGSLIVAGAQHILMRLDKEAGQVIWQVNTPIALTAGVGADGDTIAVVGEKGILLTYDLSGKLRWQTQLSSEVISPPVVAHGVVVVHSLDNKIVAYDAYTGERRWIVERTSPLLALHHVTPMTIVDDAVVVGLSGGKLIAIALKNGTIYWEVKIAEPFGATELERLVDVVGPPAVFDVDVCAGAYQGKIACFYLQNGTMRWSRSFSTDVGVAVDARFVFAADQKSQVYAFERTTGQVEWESKALMYRGILRLVSFGRSLVVSDHYGYIHFISRENGAYLARIETGGGAVAAPFILLDNQLIFQTQSGKIAAVTH